MAGAAGSAGGADTGGGLAAPVPAGWQPASPIVDRAMATIANTLVVFNSQSAAGERCPGSPEAAVERGEKDRFCFMAVRPRRDGFFR